MCPPRMANSIGGGAADGMGRMGRRDRQEPSGSSPTGAGHLAREDRKPPAESRRGLSLAAGPTGAPGFTGGISTGHLSRHQAADGTGAGACDTGIRRRRCSACTCSRVRRVAAATEFRTGCAAARGSVRPCVRSQARIRASGALAVAESSSNSFRRTSSECACSSAMRARKSEDSSPGIIGMWVCKAKLLRAWNRSLRAREKD